MTRAYKAAPLQCQCHKFNCFLIAADIHIVEIFFTSKNMNFRLPWTYHAYVKLKSGKKLYNSIQKVLHIPVFAFTEMQICVLKIKYFFKSFLVWNSVSLTLENSFFFTIHYYSIFLSALSYACFQHTLDRLFK